MASEARFHNVCASSRSSSPAPDGHSHCEASSAIPAPLWELVAVYGAKRMRTVPDDKPAIDMILSLAL
jgi:hypothetical protein